MRHLPNGGIQQDRGEPGQASSREQLSNCGLREIETAPFAEARQVNAWVWMIFWLIGMALHPIFSLLKEKEKRPIPASRNRSSISYLRYAEKLLPRAD
jgi:hypothetical protein